jgi:hypothetical protein
VVGDHQPVHAAGVGGPGLVQHRLPAPGVFGGEGRQRYRQGGRRPES